MTSFGMRELMMLMKDVEDWNFDNEGEALRAPMRLIPTKTTNLHVTTVRARNTLAIGHRRRNSRIGEVK